ncbi:hypothetical protein ACJZ2D_016975 [Fusarium nematophilum]
MPANTTILYPKLGGDEWFDLDYYVRKHMALVAEKWAPFGLVSWQVLKFIGDDGHDAEYSIGAFCNWESLEGAKEAIRAEESKIIFEDIINFSSVKPLHMMATIEGGSSVGQ